MYLVIFPKETTLKLLIYLPQWRYHQEDTNFIWFICNIVSLCNVTKYPLTAKYSWFESLFQNLNWRKSVKEIVGSSWWYVYKTYKRGLLGTTIKRHKLTCHNSIYFGWLVHYQDYRFVQSELIYSRILCNFL